MTPLDGSAALLRASEANDVSEIAHWLDNGEDPNARDKYDYTPLMCAVLRGRLEAARLLLQRGADVNALASHGERALHLAERTSNLGILQMLLEHGADVNAQDKLGWSALMSAAQRANHTKVLHILLDAGAAINMANPESGTALIIAAGHRRTENVRLLLKHGADTFAINGDGQNALEVAQSYGHERIVKLIEKSRLKVPC